MNCIKKMKAEFRTVQMKNLTIALAAGTAAALFCLIACGNFYVYPLLLLPKHAPPPFLFYFAFVLWIDGQCCSAAAVPNGYRRCDAADRILILLPVIFMLLFYIAFIRTASFAFALIMLLCAAALQVLSIRRTLAFALPATVLECVTAMMSLLFLWLDVAAILLN